MLMLLFLAWPAELVELRYPSGLALSMGLPIIILNIHSQDSWLIDYEATKNSLLAGKSAGAKHFVLLSGLLLTNFSISLVESVQA